MITKTLYIYLDLEHVNCSAYTISNNVSALSGNLKDSAPPNSASVCNPGMFVINSKGGSNSK